LDLINSVAVIKNTDTALKDQYNNQEEGFITYH